MGLFDIFKKSVKTMKAVEKVINKEDYTFKLPQVNKIKFDTSKSLVNITDESDLSEIRESIKWYMQDNEINGFGQSDYNKWIKDNYDCYDFDVESIWDMIDNKNFKSQEKYGSLYKYGQDLDLLFSHGVDEIEQDLVDRLKNINVLDDLQTLKDELFAIYKADIQKTISPLPQVVQKHILDNLPS